MTKWKFPIYKWTLKNLLLKRYFFVTFSAPEIAAVTWQDDKVQLTFTGATAAESYKLCEDNKTVDAPAIDANKTFAPADGIKSYSLAACQGNKCQCWDKVFMVVKGTKAGEIQTAINVVAQNTNYIPSFAKATFNCRKLLQLKMLIKLVSC